jgi:glutamyl-tRNA synthetase
LAAQITVRFAPSPTGYLQLGNARTALVNWLFARQHGGTFLLRLDDTDQARGDETYVAAIREDLTWLGLNWDREFRQSARLARYHEALRRLEAGGDIYPCYETEAELEAKRKAQAARRQAPVYDRAALKLSDADKRAYEAEGRTPHWRFKLADGPVTWDDRVRGRQSVQAGAISDPVLIRADGRPLYTLTSVVDDLESGITHVIRGEDHVTNTAAQIQLFHALGGRAPEFAHLPLLLDAAGEKLSKRTQGLSLRALRADEVEAMALNSYLAKLGTSDPIEERQSLNALIDAFDLSRMARGAPRYDGDELMRLNARLLHPPGRARPRRRRPRLLGDGPPEPDPTVGRQAVVPGLPGHGGTDRGGARLPRHRRRTAAARAVGGDHLAAVDRRAQAAHRAQGQGPVPAAPPGADRHGEGPGTRPLPAPDRPGEGAQAAERGDRLAPRRVRASRGGGVRFAGAPGSPRNFRHRARRAAHLEQDAERRSHLSAESCSHLKPLEQNSQSRSTRPSLILR